jgi:radical SAM superfamily enzyme with C-terminal helix-hairpin-helix motif
MGEYGEKLGKDRLVIWWGSRGAHWAFSKFCPFCGENIEGGWDNREPIDGVTEIDETEVFE